MRSFELINIQWNNVNGIIAGLLGYDDRYLFSIEAAWKSYFTINILYFRLELYKTWEN